MSYYVGDLDVARAAALIAAACRKDDLGLAHHAAEAHDEQRCHLLTFSVVECFADLLGPQFYTEEIAEHFSKFAAHHRGKYDEQMETSAAQQVKDNNEEATE